MASRGQEVGGSQKPKSGLGTYVGLCVLAIAPLAVGVAMLTVRHLSLRELRAAQTWVETSCIIERCEFVTHDDEQMLEIVYRYHFDGRDYQGDRLDLIIGRMGDDDVFEEAMHDANPPGAHATCFVDPANPSRSVFDRSHGADAARRMWLLAFPFLCVGLGFSLVLVFALVDSFRRIKPHGPSRRSRLTTDPGSPPRNVPWLTQLTVLAGAAAVQFAWVFVVGFAFVFVILDGPAAYARLFDFFPDRMTVVGRVTDVRELDERELYVSLHQYTIVYEVDGKGYSSDSYTRGEKYKEGDEVAIAFDPSAPDKGTIVGTRPSNFTWMHSAIPLGVLLLLTLGLGGMYLHNIRALRLLKHGQVTEAEWIAPPPTSPEVGGDSRHIATMLSHYHFQVDGRSHRARKYTTGSRPKHRSTSSAASQQDKVVVLYHPSRPSRNMILDGPLADLIDGCRSPWDRFVHFAPAPLAVIALVALLKGAELI